MSELAFMPPLVVGTCAMSQEGGLLFTFFVGKSANMDKTHLLQAIKEQLRKKGLSAAEASERAVGNPYLISNMGRERYGLPSTENLQALCDVIGLEFYVGPPRESAAVETVTTDSSEYVHVPLHDALLAAGGGISNGSEEVLEHLAFRSEWLKRIGVAASNARLARVHGDSMQPTLWPGDMILIDSRGTLPTVRSRGGRDMRRSPIYAILDNGEARIKRIERPHDDRLILLSDNPDYSPEVRQGDEVKNIDIIGKVVWWGHTATE